jgi:hypothetical protein
MGHDGGGISLDVSGIEYAIDRVEAELALVMPVALRQAGDQVAQSARENHGYQDRSGNLTRSIYADPVDGSFGGGRLEVVVAANANYGAPIEFGSKPHKITAKPGGTLRFGTISGVVFAQSVDHPGNPAFRFMAEALEREIDDITITFENALADAFEAAGFDTTF